jgi:preprotein translocase subunit YajC
VKAALYKRAQRAGSGGSPAEPSIPTDPPMPQGNGGPGHSPSSNPAQGQPLMLISPAYAQASASSEALLNIVPIVLMFVIFYFLLIRPQQQRARQHRETVASIRRGDTVVLSSGIIGKVMKAKDGESEIDVEIAKDTVVKVIRGTIAEVRSKGDAPKDAS